MEHVREDIDLPGRGLRVLAVTNMWPTATTHRGAFVRDQVEALRRLGVDVDVEVVCNLGRSRDYLFAVPRVRRRIAAGGRSGRPYDLVHVHYGLTAITTRFAGPIPQVVSFYGSDVNSSRRRRLAKLGMGRFVKRRVFVSHRLARTFGDEKGDVIPNGVDFEVFAPGDRVERRRRFEIEQGEQVVLFGGYRSDPVKGYDVYAAVLAELRQRGLSVRELVLTVPELDRPIEEVVAKIDAADCLLFCSRYGSEGSPTIVKEAVAMGLPVVSVDVGDVSEVLAGVAPSAVVEFPQPWGTEVARARLVTTLADNVAAVLSSGTRSNGRDRIQWLARESIARRVLAMYREVLAA